MIKIAIANKCEHDRKTIVALLTTQDDFHIASIGRDGYDAITSAKLHHPDIIIMDFSMNDMVSLDLAPIIKRNSPSTAIIVLYSHEERSAVNKVFQAGISGCLPRQEMIENLAASIRSVFYGGLYLSKFDKDQALQREKYEGLFDSLARHEKILFPFPQLCFSSTELQIFSGIACGRTDREIARDLNLHIGSLRNCINQVKRRTGLQNRTQIITYALLAGIISFEKIRDSLKIISPEEIEETAASA